MTADLVPVIREFANLSPGHVVAVPAELRAVHIEGAMHAVVGEHLIGLKLRCRAVVERQGDDRLRRGVRRAGDGQTKATGEDGQKPPCPVAADRSALHA